MAMTPAERAKRWRERHPEYNQIYRKGALERRRKNKRVVMTHYGGGKCACIKCGEARLACLSIDHIKGDGASDRRKLGLGHSSSERFYSWLIRVGFPEGYQTLCMNCQWVKRFIRHEHN